MKIIYIAGDGRSGSTLLDSILSNIEGSISVGECHRFWIRYYEGESRCGCGEHITNCKLWSAVDKELRQLYNDYNPEEFKRRVTEIQKYKNFNEINSFIKKDSWKSFCEQVISFYKIIASYAAKGIIIDSSKSISWAYFLEKLNFTSLYIIHLERDLPSVSNSWKKKVILPEYTEKEVYMPIKSLKVSAKTWLKIKYMAQRLKKAKHYLYVSYNSLCGDPLYWINEVKNFVNECLDETNLVMKQTHAIGGNPMRALDNKTISIVSQKNNNKHLSTIEQIGLSFVNKIANILLR